MNSSENLEWAPWRPARAPASALTKAALAVVLALAAVWACAFPLFAFQAAPKAKGGLEGRVVNAATGDAVRKVNLTLLPNQDTHDPHDSHEPLTAQTDDKGGFSFHDLAPGSYRLGGEKAGFEKQHYGARLNPNMGVLLSVKAGEAVKDVTFKLIPNAVIGGRVLDQDGEIMPNLTVSALRSTYVRGKRQWTQAGGATTNDRGEFRIAGLRPGKYIVGATDLNIGIGIAGVTKGPLPDKPEPAYGTTYFGNTGDMARAVPVEVRMGDDRHGADIQMIKTTAVRVRGKVVGAPDGKILVVMLIRKGGPGMGAAPGGVGIVQPTDASFEIKNVAPGAYVLMARSATAVTEPMGAPMPIEVGDRHIDGVEFSLSPGGSELSGTVTIPGYKPTAEKTVTVTLERLDFQTGDSPAAKLGEDGTFTLKNAFTGRYRVRVSGLPDNAYVKTVKFGGQELDQDGADWNGGSGSLEIQVSRTGAQLEGTIVGPDGKPLSGATAVLIPESRRESLYRNATAEADGTFNMKGLAPGKYKLLAWEDLEQGAFLDPDFVKPYERSAQDLVVEENGKVKLTVTAVR